VGLPDLAPLEPREEIGCISAGEPGEAGPGELGSGELGERRRSVRGVRVRLVEAVLREVDDAQAASIAARCLCGGASFLAVALMEACDIRVDVCTDPSYSEVEGFVLRPGVNALVANWVRAEGIWHVDNRFGRATLDDFSEAVRYAAHTSVARHERVLGRLLAFADYLDLDYGWLRARCRSALESGLWTMPPAVLDLVAQVQERVAPGCCRPWPDLLATVGVS
jgi:hypothetical protein